MATAAAARVAVQLFTTSYPGMKEAELAVVQCAETTDAMVTRLEDAPEDLEWWERALQETTHRYRQTGDYCVRFSVYARRADKMVGRRCMGTFYEVFGG